MTNNGIFMARNFSKWHEVGFLWHEVEAPSQMEVETRRHEDTKARSFFIKQIR